MKIFAFLMAFLVLGLSVLPCMDAKAATINAKYPVVQGLDADANDHQNNDHEDNCSPLCICGCCSVASIYNPVISVEITPAESQIRHISYYSGLLISFSFPIWQPPQLA